jgi:hypothetical protein
MRYPTLATILGTALLAGTTGLALADSAYTASERVQPLPGGHFLCDVSFRFDDVAIGSAGSAELDDAVRAMQTNTDALIVLDGHTDAVGSEVYNTGLAIRRAEAVKDGLVARGIDPDRVVIAVYGENGADGGADRQDRRVDLWMTYAVSMDAIVDRTLVAGDAVVWSQPLTQREFEATPSLTAWRKVEPKKDKLGRTVAVSEPVLTRTTIAGGSSARTASR